MKLNTITLFDESMQILTVINAANDQEKSAIFAQDNMCIAVISENTIYLDLSCAYFERQDEDEDIDVIVSEIETELKKSDLRIVIINDDDDLLREYMSQLERALFDENV